MKYILLLMIVGCQVKQDCPEIEEKAIEDKPLKIDKVRYREFNGKRYIYDGGIWVSAKEYEEHYL